MLCFYQYYVKWSVCSRIIIPFIGGILLRSHNLIWWYLHANEWYWKCRYTNVMAVDVIGLFATRVFFTYKKNRKQVVLLARSEAAEWNRSYIYITINVRRMDSSKQRQRHSNVDWTPKLWSSIIWKSQKMPKAKTQIQEFD